MDQVHGMTWGINLLFKDAFLKYLLKCGRLRK